MNIKIYTKHGCVYCKKLKKLLKNNNLKYENVTITLKNKSEIMKMLKPKIKNHNTVPIIFINHKFIGGYNEMYSLLNKI
jgi:glutaredoxin